MARLEKSRAQAQAGSKPTPAKPSNPTGLQPQPIRSGLAKPKRPSPTQPNLAAHPRPTQSNPGQTGPNRAKPGAPPRTNPAQPGPTLPRSANPARAMRGLGAPAQSAHPLLRLDSARRRLESEALGSGSETRRSDGLMPTQGKPIGRKPGESPSSAQPPPSGWRQRGQNARNGNRKNNKREMSKGEAQRRNRSDVGPRPAPRRPKDPPKRPKPPRDPPPPPASNPDRAERRRIFPKRRIRGARFRLLIAARPPNRRRPRPRFFRSVAPFYRKTNSRPRKMSHIRFFPFYFLPKNCDSRRARGGGGTRARRGLGGRGALARAPCGLVAAPVPSAPDTLGRFRPLFHSLVSMGFAGL